MWKKVIGPTILVSLLWIAGSSITNYYVHRVYEYHSRVLEENVSTIRAAWAMQDALWRLQAVVMEAAGKEHRETRIEATELESAFQRHLEEAEKTSFTPEEKALVKAAQEHFAVYRDHIEARLQPSGLVGLLTPQSAEKEKTIRLARAVAEPCRQLVELNERILADSTLQSARLSTTVNLLRLAFLDCGTDCGLALRSVGCSRAAPLDFADQCHAQRRHGRPEPRGGFGGGAKPGRFARSAPTSASSCGTPPASDGRTPADPPSSDVGRAIGGGWGVGGRRCP